MRAWGEQVLLALVLKLIADKLIRLMEIALEEADKASMTPEFRGLLTDLRDHIADLAIGDRTDFTNAAIASWSRLLSLFRRGTLAADPEAYEVVSSSVPNNLEADRNVQANGLGRLGVALSLLQHGRTAGLWELAPAAAPRRVDNRQALTARGNWAGAPERPQFDRDLRRYGRRQGAVCGGDGAMSDSPLVNAILGRLHEAGYRDLAAPFQVATVEFEFTAALRGSDGRALDLVLVVDTTTGEFGDRDSARVRQRIEVSRTRFPWTQNWLNRSVQGGPEHDRQF